MESSVASRLPVMAQTLASPTATHSGAVDVAVADSEMLKVLLDLTAKQRTFSTQKKRKESDKLIESSRAKLQKESMIQLNKIHSKRETEATHIKNLLIKAHERIVEYNTRSDEFHICVKARLMMHIDSYASFHSDLQAALTASTHSSVSNEIEAETVAIKDQLKGKMLQLEERLQKIERQYVKDRSISTAGLRI
jgi:hypothetical protein